MLFGGIYVDFLSTPSSKIQPWAEDLMTVHRSSHPEHPGHEDVDFCSSKTSGDKHTDPLLEVRTAVAKTTQCLQAGWRTTWKEPFWKLWAEHFNLVVKDCQLTTWLYIWSFRCVYLHLLRYGTGKVNTVLELSHCHLCPSLLKDKVEFLFHRKRSDVTNDLTHSHLNALGQNRVNEWLK